MDSDFLNAVDTLATDRQRGAHTLTLEAARCFAQATHAQNPHTPSLDDLRAALIGFRRGQQAMASVLRFCSEMWAALPGDDPIEIIDGQDSSGSTLHLEPVHRVASRWVAQLERTLERLVELVNGGELPVLFPLMTYSASATVSAALASIYQRGVRSVTLSVAEPSGEGRVFADSLSEMGYLVKLLSDSFLLEEAAEATYLLLLGADAFTPYGFQNKTGSGALAAQIARGGGKTVILAGREKLLPHSVKRELSGTGNTFDWLTSSEHAINTEEPRSIAFYGGHVTLYQPLFGWYDYSDIWGVLTDSGWMPVHNGQLEVGDAPDLHVPEALTWQSLRST